MFKLGVSVITHHASTSHIFPQKLPLCPVMKRALFPQPATAAQEWRNLLGHGAPENMLRTKTAATPARGYCWTHGKQRTQRGISSSKFSIISSESSKWKFKGERDPTYGTIHIHVHIGVGLCVCASVCAHPSIDCQAFCAPGFLCISFTFPVTRRDPSNNLIINYSSFCAIQS